MLHQRLVLKVYPPNLLRTDDYIDYNQKMHYDFIVGLPSNVLKKNNPKKI